MIPLPDYRRRVDRMLGRYRAAAERAKAEWGARDALDARLEALTEAVALAQAVAEGVQSRAHARLAGIASRCLAIFDEPYEFRIIFERARGRTEARISFVRDGLEVDPLSASGGGVVDVAAFALRAACLVLRRPPLRRLLLLDEPFRFLSSSYRPRARALLEALAGDLGCQAVLVTHDEGLRAGAAVELGG